VCPYGEAATFRAAQPPACTHTSLPLFPARNLLSHQQARVEEAVQAWRTSLLRSVNSCRRPSAVVNLNCVTHGAAQGPGYRYRYRPITLQELMALSEPLENPGDDAEIREIEGICRSFLVVREATVYFVHQSAKDFLIARASDRIFPDGLKPAHRAIFGRRALEAATSLLNTQVQTIKELKKEIKQQPTACNGGPSSSQATSQPRRSGRLRNATSGQSSERTLQSRKSTQCKMKAEK
jgi:hypothetical protein